MDCPAFCHEERAPTQSQWPASAVSQTVGRVTVRSEGARSSKRYLAVLLFPGMS